MGRLDDIIARNKNPKGNRERLTVSIGFGLFILVILALMVFTDLGKRPDPSPPTKAVPDHRVDDVKLRTPRAPADAGSAR